MTTLLHPPAQAAEKKIHIVQGEQYVDDNPNTVLTTILGSCIAACIWDNTLGLGGMNHFLLPGTDAGSQQRQLEGDVMRFGVHAMELLVNGLLRRGAQRNRLQAKLFGGARMIKGLTDIGELNATFAERFLKAEGIAIAGGSLRGEQGRRIQFWPVTGRARQVLLAKETESIMRAERTRPIPPTPPGQGTVELF
ncbi:putative chemoreceptor glutamine deamidase CheD [Acidocella aquatica]|uniref:Probable chemoreceptor glutamine deamidase CheD n=1 Tax=Acidocella aquatica TaxID=1922313 RepID=A0ABQ6A133_9PROT|nr:chemotaxis protein CheD [Acidocella aquatica]GLR66141.1 putative chemoreceptor glutamine deamidase CheD [Acidocella aquatica]